MGEPLDVLQPGVWVQEVTGPGVEARTVGGRVQALVAAPARQVWLTEQRADGQTVTWALPDTARVDVAAVPSTEVYEDGRLLGTVTPADSGGRQVWLADAHPNRGLDNAMYGDVWTGRSEDDAYRHLYEKQRDRVDAQPTPPNPPLASSSSRYGDGAEVAPVPAVLVRLADELARSGCVVRIAALAPGRARDPQRTDDQWQLTCLRDRNQLLELTFADGPDGLVAVGTPAVRHTGDQASRTPVPIAATQMPQPRYHVTYTNAISDRSPRLHSEHDSFADCQAYLASDAGRPFNNTRIRVTERVSDTAWAADPRAVAEWLLTAPADTYTWHYTGPLGHHSGVASSAITAIQAIAGGTWVRGKSPSSRRQEPLAGADFPAGFTFTLRGTQVTFAELHAAARATAAGNPRGAEDLRRAEEALARTVARARAAAQTTAAATTAATTTAVATATAVADEPEMTVLPLLVHGTAVWPEMDPLDLLFLPRESLESSPQARADAAERGSQAKAAARALRQDTGRAWAELFGAHPDPGIEDADFLTGLTEPAGRRAGDRQFPQLGWPTVDLLCAVAGRSPANPDTERPGTGRELPSSFIREQVHARLETLADAGLVVYDEDGWRRQPECWPWQLTDHGHDRLTAFLSIRQPLWTPGTRVLIGTPGRHPPATADPRRLGEISEAVSEAVVRDCVPDYSGGLPGWGLDLAATDGRETTVPLLPDGTCHDPAIRIQPLPAPPHGATRPPPPAQAGSRTGPQAGSSSGDGPGGGPVAGPPRSDSGPDAGRQDAERIHGWLHGQPHGKPRHGRRGGPPGEAER